MGSGWEQHSLIFFSVIFRRDDGLVIHMFIFGLVLDFTFLFSCVYVVGGADACVCTYVDVKIGVFHQQLSTCLLFVWNRAFH